MASLQHGSGFPAIVAVVAMAPEAARNFQHSTGLLGTILVDPDDVVTLAYQSSHCPRLWGHSAGRIVYGSETGLEGAALVKALRGVQQEYASRHILSSSPAASVL